jgi:hypothetical protein
MTFAYMIVDFADCSYFSDGEQERILVLLSRGLRSMEGYLDFLLWLKRAKQNEHSARFSSNIFSMMIFVALCCLRHFFGSAVPGRGRWNSEFRVGFALSGCS